jgi:CRP-like cAMP-binding protein
MISPEVLRRYSFFGFLNPDHQKAIAMIAEQIEIEKECTVLEEGYPADAIYLLEEGNLDLIFVVKDETKPQFSRIYNVGEINPGEPFGISGLIEPFVYTTTIRAASDSKCIKIDAAALRALCEVDQRLAYALMRQVARAAMERLAATRVQLAGAR